MDTFHAAWEYEPKDAIEFPIEGYKIDRGKITYSSPIEDKDQASELAKRATSALEIHCLAIGIERDRDIKLTGPTYQIDRADGSKIVFVGASCSITASFKADFQVLNQARAIIFDSKQSRQVTQSELASLLGSRIMDFTADKMLRALRAALTDRPNELIHRREIIEALKLQFGSMDAIANQLGVAGLGRAYGTCCDEHIRQSAHRGKATRELRDATPNELSDVRNLTTAAFISYLKQLPRK
jgi:hypothetical protein